MTRRLDGGRLPAMRSQYATACAPTPCCEATLHRPAGAGRVDQGAWFCMTCGTTYHLDATGRVYL